MACSGSELTSETMNYFFLNVITGLLGWGSSPSSGLYLHKTEQHRKMWTYTRVCPKVSGLAASSENYK
jgi:hypothetical protein